MIDPLLLIAFLPAALALNLTPGADMMLCIALGLRAGPRAAVAASAGVSTGAMVHVTLAGLGLGAAMAALPGLFTAIRWIGAAYLLYLAWSMLKAPAPELAAVPRRERPFRTGLVTNLSNPKVILFILAFLPQFTSPERGPLLPQFLILGAVIAAGGFVINAGAGALAGRLGTRLGTRLGAGLWLRRLSATIFAGLALRLILQRSAP
ncbi:LysE family translocator [Pseudoroseicyclus sp. CXY001]|uniref:LysE family translocator n=1 Tax=Pseudoroseicyclus sp. CXY001 TaxID=3242492 RepID=UPI00358DBB3D